MGLSSLSAVAWPYLIRLVAKLTPLEVCYHVDTVAESQNNQCRNQEVIVLEKEW